MQVAHSHLIAACRAQPRDNPMIASEFSESVVEAGRPSVAEGLGYDGSVTARRLRPENPPPSAPIPATAM